MNREKAEEKARRNNSKKTGRTNQASPKTGIQSRQPQSKECDLVPAEAMEI